MNDIDKLDYIIEALAELKTLVSTPKRLRNNLRPLEPGETPDRAGDMKRVFSLAAATHYAKKSAQHFPEGTYNLKNDRIEIMPRSILINRCSLRKAFRPRADELGKKTIPEIVNETLDKLIESGFFIQSRLGEALQNNTSTSLCIFSRDEAKKVGLLSATIDTSPWTPAKKPSVEPLGEYLKARGIEVPEIAPKPTEDAFVDQETLIREMREAESEGSLDEDVVLERSEESKGRVKL